MSNAHAVWYCSWHSGSSTQKTETLTSTNNTTSSLGKTRCFWSDNLFQFYFIVSEQVSFTWILCLQISMCFILFTAWPLLHLIFSSFISQSLRMYLSPEYSACKSLCAWLCLQISMYLSPEYSACKSWVRTVALIDAFQNISSHVCWYPFSLAFADSFYAYS